jgi:membrane-bound ClpP family serine protease
MPSAGPWGAPTPEPTVPPPTRPRAAFDNLRQWLSTAFLCLIILGLGIRAYRDLSRPGAWAYWQELCFSPTMTSSLIPDVSLGSSGRPALAISGTIGAASASWFRDRLDEAHLSAGDTVVMSSPGGDLIQAMIMGENIRARGLATAVGDVDTAGHIKPSHCASACVLVFAGGSIRYGVEGSPLGVHRFVTSTPGRDPVAETQRTTGAVLSYVTRMGVSPSIVEAMSETKEVRWLGAQQAAAMNLITNPVPRP